MSAALPVRAWLLLRVPATEAEPLSVGVDPSPHPPRPFGVRVHVLTFGEGTSFRAAEAALIHSVSSDSGWSWIRPLLSSADERLLFGGVSRRPAAVGVRFGQLSAEDQAALPAGTQLGPIPGRPSFDNTLVKVPPNARGLTWATLEPAGPSEPHESDRSVEKQRPILSLSPSPTPESP